MFCNRYNKCNQRDYGIIYKSIYLNETFKINNAQLCSWLNNFFAKRKPADKVNKLSKFEKEVIFFCRPLVASFPCIKGKSKSI